MTTICPCCRQPVPEGTADSILFDAASGRLAYRGAQVQLTAAMAAAFAELLAAAPGMAARDRLLKALRPNGGATGERARKIVAVQMCHLRKRVRLLGLSIVGARGFGYRLEAA